MSNHLYLIEVAVCMILSRYRSMCILFEDAIDSAKRDINVFATPITAMM